ncbi:MAG: hypothetical protein ACM3VT_00400 [Solirubrobacterales bacterium]
MGRTERFFNRFPWCERTTSLVDEFPVSQDYLEGEPALNLPAGGLSMSKYAPRQR